MDLVSFTHKVNALLDKKGMLPKKKSKVVIKSFYQHFLAQAWYFHSIYGDGEEMLDILSDDNKLIGGAQFNTNFVVPMVSLQQPELAHNSTWKHLAASIISFKAERIGAGEFFFPFVIEGWSFQKADGKGDGYVAGGMREIKDGGASLKPIINASHRIIDHLTATVFEGNRCGPATETVKTKGQSFGRWLTWFNTKPNKEDILTDFFTQLYPGRDVTELAKELATKTTCQSFYNAIGQTVLKWYKETDGWDSLVLINQQKMIVANIADVNDLSVFPTIKFDWASARGGDVRQLADGYVNVSI